MKNKGFTLIELAVVVAILCLLGVIIIGAVGVEQERMESKKAELVAALSENDAVTDAHAAGYDYRDAKYYKAVVTDASGDFEPVCVHGIPAFIAKRGDRAGELILLGNQRGHKAEGRWWSACYTMGKNLVKEHEGD